MAKFKVEGTLYELLTPEQYASLSNSVDESVLENYLKKIDANSAYATKELVNGHISQTGNVHGLTKSDITALGIPAQDTKYTHPTNHSADMITETTTRKFMTGAEKTKLGDLTYFRGLTQAQYDALSPTEKARTDVLYGVYE